VVIAELKVKPDCVDAFLALALDDAAPRLTVLNT